jgi:hypothetical protein
MKAFEPSGENSWPNLGTITSPVIAEILIPKFFKSVSYSAKVSVVLK